MQAGAVVLRLQRLDVAQRFTVWQRPVVATQKFDRCFGVLRRRGRPIMPVLVGADVEIKHRLTQGTDFSQRIDGSRFIHASVQVVVHGFEQLVRIPRHHDLTGIRPAEPRTLNLPRLRGFFYEPIPRLAQWRAALDLKHFAERQQLDVYKITHGAVCVCRVCKFAAPR